MEMRRKNRKVTDYQEIKSILSECEVCRIGLSDEEGIYIVPVNFGFEYTEENLTLYFHSGKLGRKMSLLRNSCNVAVEMDCRHNLMSGNAACEYSYYFASLIGTGIATILETEQEKKKGLMLLMKQLTGQAEFEFEKKWLEAVAVVKIEVKDFACKMHKK